jgi:four helix bundle protein
MKITKFEDLQIWQLSLKITKDIYDLTAKPLFMKDFVLKDQLRRAIVSISSNIVEGFEKNNNNEFIRFLKIAKGSLGEVRSQLYIALAVRYISQDEFDFVNQQLLDLANQVGAFIIYLQTKRKNGEFVTR